MRPTDFGLFPPDKSIRVLELGAGTGLLSILCRKLLDLHHATLGTGGTSPGLVVATDFHPDVLSNLKVCVDLNSPPHTNEDGAAIMSLTDNSSDSGLHIAKLDWATLPVNMQASTSSSGGAEEAQEITRFLDRPFDVVLASDCVYDPNHADLLRQVASWVLRPPSGPEDDIGGTFVCPRDMRHALG